MITAVFICSLYYNAGSFLWSDWRKETYIVRSSVQCDHIGEKVGSMYPTTRAYIRGDAGEELMLLKACGQDMVDCKDMTKIN